MELSEGEAAARGGDGTAELLAGYRSPTIFRVRFLPLWVDKLYPLNIFRNHSNYLLNNS